MVAHTLWKYKQFTTTHFLREINVGNLQRLWNGQNGHLWVSNSPKSISRKISEGENSWISTLCGTAQKLFSKQPCAILQNPPSPLRNSRTKKIGGTDWLSLVFFVWNRVAKCFTNPRKNREIVFKIFQKRDFTNFCDKMTKNRDS